MAPDRARFPRRCRLTRRSEHTTVVHEGKRIRSQHLEIRAVASLLRHPRVGFIVPKYGRNSVARNRLKRRLREIVRRELLPYVSAVDIVVRTRREAYEVSFTVLREQLIWLRDRLLVLFSE